MFRWIWRIFGGNEQDDDIFVVATRKSFSTMKGASDHLHESFEDAMEIMPEKYDLVEAEVILSGADPSDIHAVLPLPKDGKIYKDM